MAPERRPPDPAPPAEGAALPPAPPAPVPAPAAAPPAPAPPPPAPPPAEPPDPPPAEGPVLVHLRDAETGKPCPGVLVLARSMESAPPGEAREVEVVTDGDGDLRLPEGRTWRISARSEEQAILPEMQVHRAVEGGTTAWFARMTTLRGTVRLEDPALAPRGAEVTARPPASFLLAGEGPAPGALPRWGDLVGPRELQTAVATEGGEFSLRVPAWAEGILLQARATGHIAERREISAASVEGSPGNLDFHLKKGTRIRVRVLGGGDGLPKGLVLHGSRTVSVTAEEYATRQEELTASPGATGAIVEKGTGRMIVTMSAPERTDASGEAVLTLPGPPGEGSSAVVVNAPGHEPFVRRWEAGQDPGDIEVALKPLPPVRASYRLRRDGAFLPEGARVMITTWREGVTLDAGIRITGPGGSLGSEGILPGERYGLDIDLPPREGRREHLSGMLAFGEEEILDLAGFESEWMQALPELPERRRR
ncbi:MAG: hypothetical protein L6R43_11590 [Planctomycetes bacterium]|nr:hypothetical protein [Planctomycetota bacterium]